MADVADNAAPDTDGGRRTELADAAVRVLAREGGRGLTHHAVDEEAGAPTGTTSGCFHSTSALIDAVAEQIAARLAPEAFGLERLAAAAPSRAVFAVHLRDFVRRLSRHRDLLLALFELRLAAARRSEVTGTWLPDVAFYAPAGPAGIALHHAVDGLLLDRLTGSIDPDTTLDEVIDTLVAALLPGTPPITRPRAVAYVVRDGAVLVFTHRPTPCTEAAGLQVPGGTVHDGEDPAAAVVREVREETGLEVEVIRPLGTVTSGGRELHHFHVSPMGEVPQAWDHDEMSDGDVPLWTFSLFWLPIPVARHAIDHGMGDLLDRL